MSDLVRALGIDHGTVRIGVAACDEIGLIAFPLETIPATDEHRALARVAELAKTREIADLVVGLPLHLDGREGEAAARVRAFVARLRPLLPESVTIHEIDETLSTATAYDKLRAAGRTVKKAKPIIDQAAAVEILQAWLDQR